MSDLTAWARAIGQTIRRIRLSQGLTQSDLAGDDFSKSYISQLERGSVVPSLRALDVLAGRLGVPSTFFIEGTGKSTGFLLKIATISCFLGELDQAQQLARRLEPMADQFRYLEQLEYQLLLARLAGKTEQWDKVHEACQSVENQLAQTPYKPSSIAVPQNYWWGKAWLVEGNRRQAVRRWEMGLKHLHVQPGPPGEEGMHLMLELAELYRQLGDAESSQQITTRVKSALEQFTSLESLSRWFLARCIERAYHDDELDDVDLIGESRAVADAESWARAAAMLHAADLARQRLNDASSPPTTAPRDGS